MKETMHQRLTKLNEKITERTPGYYVKASGFGPMVWLLVGPDGEVHYTRESFEAIEAVALH